MPGSQTGRQVLDRHYLEMRSKILDLAACLDRLNAAATDGTVSDDPRLDRLNAGLQILLQPEVQDRAEQIQMLFSDPYVAGWLQKK